MEPKVSLSLNLAPWLSSKAATGNKIAQAIRDRFLTLLNWENPLKSPHRFWYVHQAQTLECLYNLQDFLGNLFTYIESINRFSRDNLVRAISPPLRQAIADALFEVNLTEATTYIALPVAEDGETEGDKPPTLTLEPGEGTKWLPMPKQAQFFKQMRRKQWCK